VKTVFLVALAGAPFLFGSCDAEQICHAGCLCYGSNPKDCPSACYPTYSTAADGSTQFSCSNSPAPDAATD
jgi:hypothetical protein